ncbi:MAG: translocation/assembly module TamB [Prevotella sp.]|nr:translocation/assembly module TamB [Prevotella sp.]
MKNLKRILSWTIWGVLSLYIAVLLLSHLSPVQSWLGQQVAAAVSAKLGTKASVGRISLGMLNRLVVDDVYIEDQTGEPLLRAGRLSVKVEMLPLLEGRIAIASAQLFRANVRLYKADETAEPNYQFVIDALSSSDDSTATSSLDLRVNSFILRNSSVSYDRGDVFATPGRLNVNHLKISDISAHVLLKALTPDTLNLNLKRLSFAEQSGLVVDRFTARIEANGSKARLSGLRLQMPRSSLLVDSVVATYDGARLQQTLSYSGVSHAVIVPAECAPLLPELGAFHTTLSLNGEFAGTAKTMEWKHLDIGSDDGSVALEAMGSVDLSQEKAAWHARVEDFRVGADLLRQLCSTFPQLPAETARVGALGVKGEAYQQTDGSMEAAAIVGTDVGTATVMVESADGKRFTGRFDTDSLHIGRILDNDMLGALAAHVDLDGDEEEVAVSGTVDRLDYGGYSYRDIAADGAYNLQTKVTSGRLTIDDPNLQADIDMRFRDGSPETADDTRPAVAGSKAYTLNAQLTIETINPHALGLTDQWAETEFAGVIDADITASGINDARGSIDLDDFIMKDLEGDTTLCRIDNVHVKTGFGEGRHFLRVVGDMGEAELSGLFDWTTLQHSLINYTASKLPTLPGLPSDASRQSPTNNFTASLRLSDSRWMEPLLGIPLRLEAPLHIDATVDDSSHRVDLKGSLPSFTYDGSRYGHLGLDLTTEGDTANCYASLTKLMGDGGRLSLNLDAQAANNNLTTSLRWSNNEASGDQTMEMHGTVNTVTQLYTNPQGKPEAHISVKPSPMMVRGTQWQLEPCDITFTDKQVHVNRFTVAHDDQHLIVDGTASASADDMLTADLKDLEVDYILELVNFHAVEFSGLATGRIYATGLFDDFSANADLDVRQFKFLKGDMGTLHAKASWNRSLKQIDIDALADESDITALGTPSAGKGRTHIRGHVSPTNNDIHLDIAADATSVAFCRSFTESFLNGLDGTATGRVTVAGPLDHINLTGACSVTGRATVTALGTTYELRGDTVHMVPNDIQMRSFALYDKHGNRGTITGGVHHDELSDFTFDVEVEADNLLAYDFPDFDGGIICGNVMATGTADLHGRPGEVVINCNVSPQAGSTFSYNAANPDAISKQEFITWKTASVEKTQAKEEDYETSSDIYINFLINATPEATLRILMDQQTGDYITLNGNGTMRASYHNKGPFNMFGTYNVDHGTYGITIQNIIKKNFIFQPGGTIVFGGNPLNANLTLQAMYTVNGVSLSDLNIGSSFANNTVRVNCLMNIVGTPEQPRVDFDLDMPTVNSEENQMIRSVIASEQEMNQQVLYLLGIGRFYTQGVNNAGMEQYDQTTLAMQSFLSGTVSTQINEVLSQIIKSNDWNFGANISTGNEGWHNAEYEGLVSGRMLNNRLLINGQFGYRDNATQTTPSFIGDFDIRYLLTANGSLAVKAYNQTNDRYFTRSSLNTQGIGLIMKKDFDHISDLFQHRKRKK